MASKLADWDAGPLLDKSCKEYPECDEGVGERDDDA